MWHVGHSGSGAIFQTRVAALGHAAPYNGTVRVQIASSKVGGGHQSVAEALRQALVTVTGGAVQVWVDVAVLSTGVQPEAAAV